MRMHIKKLFLDSKQQNKNWDAWRVSVLPIPVFHHCDLLHNMVPRLVHSGGMQEWVIQIM